VPVAGRLHECRARGTFCRPPGRNFRCQLWSAPTQRSASVHRASLDTTSTYAAPRI
jgi:hypothetical protein